MDIFNKSELFVKEFSFLHTDELETITQILVEITHRSPSEIKPVLSAMLVQLLESETECIFSATPTEQVVAALQQSAEITDFIRYSEIKTVNSTGIKH